MRFVLIVAGAALALAGCKDELATLPEPVTMSGDALGHYCQMNLDEHPGPKGQIHLAGMAYPIFFSQVRDAIAYQRMPEQNYRIEAAYVSDMATAASWEEPGADNWILADDAFYVVGSRAVGGMGAPELVPFSDEAKAEEFVALRGGRILRMGEIRDSDVLAPVNQTPADPDSDYRKRLDAGATERNS